MRLWSLLGNSQRLDGGAMFGNVPKALWSRWVTADEHNRIPLACRALLVRGLAGKTVLFETGIGAFFAPELRQRYGVVEDRHVLLDALAAIGLSDADIDAVVLSHLHFDHAGGLLAAWAQGAPPRLLFPRARFIVGREAFARAQSPHPRDRASFIPELPQLLLASGRLELVEGERSEFLGEAVRFHRSDGHTPGMLLAEIGGRGGILFCADLIPGRPWVHLPVTMGYDRFPERLIDEKRALLDRCLELDIRLFFTHDPECAAARVRRDEQGRYTTFEERPALLGEVIH